MRSLSTNPNKRKKTKLIKSAEIKKNNSSKALENPGSSLANFLNFNNKNYFVTKNKNLLHDYDRYLQVKRERKKGIVFSALKKISYEEKKKPIIHIPESYFMVQEKGEKKAADNSKKELPEVRQIVSALVENDYNVSLAAKELGLSRRGLYNKMERYNIEVFSSVMIGGKPYPMDSHTDYYLKETDRG